MGKKIVIQKIKTATGFDEIVGKMDFDQISHSFKINVDWSSQIIVELKTGVNNVLIDINDTSGIELQGWLNVVIDSSKLNGFTQNLIFKKYTGDPILIYVVDSMADQVLIYNMNGNSSFSMESSFHVVTVNSMIIGNQRYTSIKNEEGFTAI